MRIQFELSERFYRIFERIAVSLDSIDRILKAPPEDFSAEDEVVKSGTTKLQEATARVEEARERIPHGT